MGGRSGKRLHHVPVAYFAGNPREGDRGAGAPPCHGRIEADLSYPYLGLKRDESAPF